MIFKRWQCVVDNEYVQWDNDSFDQIDDFIISDLPSEGSERSFIEIRISLDWSIEKGPDAYDWLITSDKKRWFVQEDDSFLFYFDSIPGASDETDRKMASIQIEEHAILSIFESATNRTYWIVQKTFEELVQRIAKAYKCKLQLVQI